MTKKPTTFDECLALASPEQRAGLNRLCKTIRAAAPKAEECVYYGLAAFRFDGKPLVAIAAAKNHYAIYPLCPAAIAALKDDFAKYETSKGTIRFPADQPIPVGLVRKLISYRIDENKGRIASRSTRVSRPRPESRTDPAVIEFLRNLDHPLKPVIMAVRKLILGVSPDIREGIKWNAPSFRTTDYFATLNLREGRVWLVLHTGAKVKASAKTGLNIADPTGLLKWLAKDRALVTFADMNDVRAKRGALAGVVKNWIDCV